MSVSPTMELAPIYNHLQMKFSFLQGSVTGEQTTLKDRPHVQQQMTNQKQIQQLL